MKFKDLLYIKWSNKQPVEGDVFVLNPRKDLYCYGKVIKTNISSNDVFVNGMTLIFIYDYFEKELIVPKNLDCNEVLLVEIINNQLWKKGYAATIHHEMVSEKELKTDYGFWNIVKKIYVNEVGKPMNHVPKVKGEFGLGSYGVIGKQIQKIINERNL